MMLPGLADGVIASPPVVCLALAYGIVFGVLGTMDLTLGVRFAASAYAAHAVTQVLGLEGDPAFHPAAWAAALAGGLVATMLTWWLVRQLEQAGQMAVLIGSLGLSFAVGAALQWAFGARPVGFAGHPVQVGHAILGTTVTPLEGLALAWTCVAVIVAAWTLTRTRFGDRLAIVSADPEFAHANLGLRRGPLAWRAVLLSACLIAPAGFLYGVGHGATSTTGSEQALLAFVAAIAAGPRRPIAAAGSAMLVVVAGRVAVRAQLLELAALMALAAILVPLALALARRRSQRATTAIVSALVIAVLAAPTVAAAIRAVAGTELGESRIPSGYQPLIPYLLLLVALLLRPRGIWAQREDRVA
ncbi:MAG: hypothetical protein K8T90_19260 [Planctomycetes bacterium]|nr:hypothetical protein [Planctomycetota bacterium]